METFFESLGSPDSWTNTQWLLLVLGVILLLAAAYFVYRLFDIIRSANKSTYTPNIGRARLRQQQEERERQQRGDDR